MIYPNNYEYKIGFTTIRTILKEWCLSQLGKDRVEEMQYETDFEKVHTKVRQTMEFIRIINEDEFPDQYFFDVREALRHIKIENTYIDPEKLFDLQRSLDSIFQIVGFLKKAENYPELTKLATDVPVFPEIIRRIGQILDKYGNIKDSASPALSDIRRQIQRTTNSISHLLGNILQQAKSEGLVEKDSTPTMRDGRLVIPVVPAMKRKLNGIVHDESDSGKTIYIEPAEVVEANNLIRELENEERREIIRILIEFSDSIRPQLPEIALSYEFLADIDFIRAKARYSISINALEPNMTDQQVIDWSMAYHPILNASLQKSGRKMNPLDILLNQKQRILLISGPNAGGKSVCLKTVGLLQYMLQCGMPVPLAESSVTGLFDSIFIDIGDEQSIENDLSTYSSHLYNMKYMMRNASGRSLILIDEFGGGTEPQIGGAIAQAVLKRFNEKKSYGVITTHYQNLKFYAKDTPGIINGAMLYDRQQMCPLFQLRIGNPGSSFAVEIARKIGLPEEVIQEASEIVGQDYINADKYLQDIVRDKRYWENKRQQIHQQEKKLESTIADYEDKLAKIKGEKREIITKAKQEAEDLLKKSNALIEQTVKEIKEAQAKKEETKQIREKLNKFKEKVTSPMPKEKQPHSQQKQEKGKTYTELTEGGYARLKGQSVVGKITKISGNEASVEFGSIKTNVKLNRLEPCGAPPKEKKPATLGIINSDLRAKKIANFKTVIDVRGMRGEECLSAIMEFIDDAIVASASNVSILHGTGDGILRELVRQYLKTIPEVISFRDELPQFGGTGITVVEIG